MTDLRKWSENAFVMLAGLKEAVQWELAPEIMKEIKELVDAYPVGAAPSEGMEPESEINWQGLYQRTEDALLALRIELGGKDYKTHAIDHVAAIRYLLKEGAALSPARSGEPPKEEKQ